MKQADDSFKFGGYRRTRKKEEKMLGDIQPQQTPNSRAEKRGKQQTQKMDKNKSEGRMMDNERNET